MKLVNVMQVTDTLAPGGLERVAVNLANCLPRDRYRSHLCCTREEGPLARLIEPDVNRLNLQRRKRMDWQAISRLAKYIREHEIKILHAHGTSLFVSVLASLMKPRPAVIWHDHFGRYATEERPVWIYRLAANRVAGVITVNQPLAQWARKRLKIKPDLVWSIANFASKPKVTGNCPELPGTPGLRIVCVANLRPEKDHPNLLDAMQRVVKQIPGAHLLLLGKSGDRNYQEQIQQLMAKECLESKVTWLGSRGDVYEILRDCDVGVLSSRSEGAPLALIEYGLAGLPVVATNVGQSSEALDHGRCGVLVPPSSPELLSRAILALLRSSEKRVALGRRFRQRVEENYGENTIIKQIEQVYEKVLSSRRQERI